MGDVVDINPLRREDVYAYYGHDLRYSVRGWAVFLNGTLFGICGISFGTGALIAFSDFLPINVPAVLKWRIARVLFGLVTNMGYNRFYAVANPNIPNSVEFLQRLGFNHVESSVRGEVFEWQTH